MELPIKNFVADDRRAQLELLRERCEFIGFNVVGWIRGRASLVLALVPVDDQCDGGVDVYGDLADEETFAIRGNVEGVARFKWGLKELRRSADAECVTFGFDGNRHQVTVGGDVEEFRPVRPACTACPRTLG